MSKRILVLLMLALTCTFLLVGCGGSDGSDGKDGADADSAAIIAELKAQLESGAITIAQYEQAIADLQAAATAGKITQVESCAVCHNDVAGTHEVEAYPAASGIGVTYGADTATITFSAKVDGVALSGAAQGVTPTVSAYAYYYVAAQSTAIAGTQETTRGFVRASIPSASVAISETGTTGDYTVVLSNMAVNAPNLTLGTTPVRFMLTFNKPVSSTQSAQAMTFTYDSGTLPELLVDDNGCVRCHTSVFETNAATATAHHGAYQPQGKACVVCHSRAAGYSNGTLGGGSGSSTELGHRLTNYVHGVHNSENMLGGIFVRSYNSTTNEPTTTTPNGSNTFAIGFPTNVADCEVCHTSSTQVAAVTADTQMNLTLCKSCHRGNKNVWNSAGAGYSDAIADVWAAIPFSTTAVRDIHTSMTEASNCLTCHGAAGIARSFNKIHTGKSASRENGKNIYYFTPEVAINTTTSVMTITWGAFIDTNSNGTYEAGTDTKVDVKNTTDTTKPIFMQSYTDRVVDGVAKSDGVRILVGYYGKGTKDVVAYDGYTKTNLTTTSAATSGYTTYDASTGKATTTVKLNATTIANYSVTGGIVGIIGIPWVNGENAIVRSVAAEYNVDGTAVTAPRGAVANDTKCDACHNSIAIHLEEASTGAHGHTAIGKVDVCRICHVPSAAAGHYPQQSRSIDSYIHAIHEGQATFASYGSLKIEYPKSTADCLACHDSGTYEVPDQSKAIGGILSGSEGKNTTADQFTYGPAAVACGGCHRAYPLIIGDAGKLASFNAHTKTFGYKVAVSDMSYLDVVKAVFKLF
ncbi:multiheme c-type cytochrome [Seleniivibrio woodruffii]|uniref:multiheme c-type cytochrome n=1 Tax=Seleniivibrio woodruffii TaxID=1078050 RepID=UPI0039E3FD8E